MGILSKRLCTFPIWDLFFFFARRSGFSGRTPDTTVGTEGDIGCWETRRRLGRHAQPKSAGILTPLLSIFFIFCICTHRNGPGSEDGAREDEEMKHSHAIWVGRIYILLCYFSNSLLGM